MFDAACRKVIEMLQAFEERADDIYVREQSNDGVLDNCLLSELPTEVKRYHMARMIVDAVAHILKGGDSNG
jgi:hypothetical protein